MDYYDITKIGKKIADGGDRKVYKYGNDQVIKFSSLSLLVGKKLHTKYAHDYLVCKKYFGKYIVETTTVSDPNTNTHIEIQPFIAGEVITEQHTRNIDIKSQLEELVQILDHMKQDGVPPIDLVGSIGMIRPCLSNIIVDPSGKLQIIDATLFEGKTVRPLGLILELCIPPILARQNHLLRRLLST